jgi:hypothetical protein
MMFRRDRNTLSQLWILIGLLALLLVTSCSNDDDPVSPGGDEDVIPTDLTDPSAVIDAYARALTKKNYEASEALLYPFFEFTPRQSDLDVIDLGGPWLPTGWPRVMELEMLTHMFDSNFEKEGVYPVQAIRFEPTILDIRQSYGDLIEVTCSCQGQVLTDENDGWFFDTMLVFQMMPVEGFLRIIHLEEEEMLRPTGTREVESSSLGVIKWGYR